MCPDYATPKGRFRLRIPHPPNIASINSTALTASPIVFTNLSGELSSSTVKELLLVFVVFFSTTLGAAVDVSAFRFRLEGRRPFFFESGVDCGLVVAIWKSQLPADHVAQDRINIIVLSTKAHESALVGTDVPVSRSIGCRQV